MKDKNTLKLKKRWYYYYDTEEQIIPVPILDHITATKTQTEYYIDDEFTVDDIVVTCYWDDETTTEVTTGFTCTAPDMTTAGTKTCTVTYRGKTTTIDIVVSSRTTYPDENLGHFFVLYNPDHDSYLYCTANSTSTTWTASSSYWKWGLGSSMNWQIWVSTDGRATWTKVKSARTSSCWLNELNTNNNGCKAENSSIIEHDYEPILTMSMEEE